MQKFAVLASLLDTTLILVATDRILIHTGLPSMLGSNSGDHLLVRTSV